MKRATLRRYQQTVTDGSVKDIFLNLTRTKPCYNSPQGGIIHMVQKQVAKQRKVGANNFILADYDQIILPSDESILIWGCPGSGKTSLVDTLLQKWASDEIWSTGGVIEFQFVFVIYFRQLNRFIGKPGITALGILRHFYPGISFEDLRRQKVSCLLILEGFDEFSGKSELGEAGQISYLTQAVHDLLSPYNPKLPFTRIVTSRPESYRLLQKLFKESRIFNNKELELTGFDYDGLDEYIHKALDLRSASQQETLFHVKRDEFLFDMMTIPFFCRGICDLIKHSALNIDEIPLTYTPLFTKLLTLHLWRNNGAGESTTTAELRHFHKCESFKKMCVNLANIAYRLKISSNIIFTNQDLPGNMDMHILIKSGLIIQLSDQATSHTYYQFLHYSFQEFLIALHCFHTGSKVEKEPCNRYIISMIAGLLGASLEHSKSNASLQAFAKLFHKKAKLSDVFECTNRSPDEALQNAASLFEYGFGNEIPENWKPLSVNFDDLKLHIRDISRMLERKVENNDLKIPL